MSVSLPWTLFKLVECFNKLIPINFTPLLSVPSNCWDCLSTSFCQGMTDFFQAACFKLCQPIHILAESSVGMNKMYFPQMFVIDFLLLFLKPTQPWNAIWSLTSTNVWSGKLAWLILLHLWSKLLIIYAWLYILFPIVTLARPAHHFWKL